MSKKVLLILIALVCIKNIYAKQIAGDIIFNNDSIVHVTFDIPINFILQEVNFIEIQQKIKYYNSTNEKFKLKPDEAKEIRFKFKDEDVRMVSCFDNLNLRDLFSSSKNIFLQLKIDGKLKLYTSYSRSSAPNSGGIVVSNFLLQKEKGDLFVPGLFFFKKNIKEYLSDCSLLINKIDNGTYARSDIELIVQEYNNCK
jgi:hypothetical protein